MQKIIFCLLAFATLILLKAHAQSVQRFDIIIDEILADPTPVIGLPSAGFIELKNMSGRTINLFGWHLTNSGTKSAAFPSYNLPADSFLIICLNTHRLLFTSYGNVVGLTSFPAFNNAGTTLSLVSKEGITIHSIGYNKSWFQNDVKSNGGWSLEMIDTHNPCSGSSNWKASTNIRGGSPGIKNSIDGVNPDKIAPALLRAAALDSATIELIFSEPVDSAKGATIANYHFTDGTINPAMAVTLPPSFSRVRLYLSTPLIANKIYTVTADNITDCSGNMIQAIKTARVGLTGTIDSLDLIINEILFNPKPGAVDFVEIYNRSGKVFNLKDLFLANRSLTTNVLGSLRRLTVNNILLFPGDFFVLSENSAVIKQNYFAKNPDNFIDVMMPSFPNNEGVVVLVNAQNKVIDELHYNSHWHFPLIDNDEGISLERIAYNKLTQSKENWVSAASSVGFGTPTYKNSQLGADFSAPGSVTITPKTFSPDNDGFDDFSTINIKMSDIGYVANITIFDALGRPVKSLVKNATLASNSIFKWDGLDDKFYKVPVGVYVVFTEVFNLNGQKRSFKNAVIVAARL